MQSLLQLRPKRGHHILEQRSVRLDLFDYIQYPLTVLTRRIHRVPEERLGEYTDDPRYIPVARTQYRRVILLDKIAQVTVNVRRLVRILDHRQPTEPDR